MKSRVGFISNSSSTSFILCLPDNFKIPEVPDSLIEEEFDREDLDKAIPELLSQKILWQFDHPQSHYILSELLKDYIVATLETQSDDGKIVIADNEVIRRVLK